MESSLLRPEIRDVIQKLPRLPFHIKPLIPVARFLMNIAARSKVSKGVEARNCSWDGLQVRVFSPRENKTDAAVLWMFGGGHLAGKPEHLNMRASAIAEATGATVFAPKYRLAPKHPYPSDLDDCFKAWQWIIDHAMSLGVNPARLAIGGNSAGGGIAAALAQRIHDVGGPQPRAQMLFYPMLDDRTAQRVELDQEEHFVWRNRTNRVAWNAYLSPNKAGADVLPKYAAAARRADLKGLPPAWIGYGDLDLFAEEDRDYATRLRESGVLVDEQVVEGAPHAFEVFSPNVTVAQEFVTSANDFLRRMLYSN